MLNISYSKFEYQWHRKLYIISWPITITITIRIQTSSARRSRAAQLPGRV